MVETTPLHGGDTERTSVQSGEDIFFEDYKKALTNKAELHRLESVLAVQEQNVEGALQTLSEAGPEKKGLSTLYRTRYKQKIENYKKLLGNLGEGAVVPGITDEVAQMYSDRWNDLSALSNEIMKKASVAPSANHEVTDFDSTKAHVEARERFKSIKRDIADAIQASVAFDFDTEGTKDDVLRAIDPEIMSDMQLHGKRILKMLDAENNNTFSEEDEEEIQSLLDEFEVLKEEAMSGIEERGAQPTEVAIGSLEAGVAVAADRIGGEIESAEKKPFKVDDIKKWGEDARSDSPAIIAAQNGRDAFAQQREMDGVVESNTRGNASRPLVGGSETENIPLTLKTDQALDEVREGIVGIVHRRVEVLRLAEERRNNSRKSLEAKYPGSMEQVSRITKGVRRMAEKSKLFQHSARAAIAAIALFASTSELNKGEGVLASILNPSLITEVGSSQGSWHDFLLNRNVTEFHSGNIDVADKQQPPSTPPPAVAEIPKREIGPEHMGVLNQGPGDSYLTVPQVGQEEVGKGVSSEVVALPKSDNELPGRLSDEYVPPGTSSGTETESISSAPDIIDQGVTTVPGARNTTEESLPTRQQGVENIKEAQSGLGSTPENLTYVVQPDDNKGVWNIMEGSGPDANPVGGQSQALKGITRTERTADLNRLVRYMEQNPDFTRSVGIESGNPHEIQPGEVLKIGVMDQLIEQLRLGNTGMSEVPIPEIRPDSSDEAVSAGSEQSTVAMSAESQNTAETNVVDNSAPEVKVPDADVVQRQMDTLVAGVERTSGGFLGLGASDIRGTYAALVDIPLNQLSEITASKLASLNVSERGFEKWANTLDTFAAVLPYTPNETLGQYIKRYVEHMVKNGNAA